MSRLTTTLTCSLLALCAAAGASAQCPTQKLGAPQPVDFAKLGASVAISGDRIVVGAPNQDVAGVMLGAAFVYVLANGSWMHEATLLASDGAQFDDFGTAVAIDGDSILVGASAVDGTLSGAVGAVYAFARTGSAWAETQKFQASDGDPGAFFGCAIAMCGDTAVIGRFWDSAPAPHAGSAYVFTRTGTQWSETQKLVASSAHAEDDFGASVAISEDRIVVGAPEMFSESDLDRQLGRAFVFERAGTTWTESAVLGSSHPETYDKFGISVAIDGDEIAVGALQDFFAPNLGGNGAAFVFDLVGASWVESQELVAADGQHNDDFGSAVAIRGSTLLVGAESRSASYPLWGGVYAFEKGASGWVQTQLFLPDANGSLSWHGWSIALDGNHAVVGAPIESFGSTQSGAAYVYGGFAPWHDEGFALTGTTGEPELIGEGSLCSGETSALRLSNAHPLSRVVLISGSTAVGLPFLGGTLVPSPDRLLRGFSTDAQGVLDFENPWPPGLGSGTTLHFQAWIRDPAGPQGWAASNAVAGAAP